MACHYPGPSLYPHGIPPAPLRCRPGASSDFDRSRSLHASLAAAWGGSASIVKNISYVYIYIYICINIISADPGLSQGRGGAWDHRMCGTTALSNCAAKATGSETLKPFPAASPSYSSRQYPQATEATAFCFCGMQGARSFYGKRGRPVLQLQQVRGRLFLQLQRVPEAMSMSFYGGSRLPFFVFLWRFKAAV